MHNDPVKNRSKLSLTHDTHALKVRRSLAALLDFDLFSFMSVLSCPNIDSYDISHPIEAPEPCIREECSDSCLFCQLAN